LEKKRKMLPVQSIGQTAVGAMVWSHATGLSGTKGGGEGDRIVSGPEGDGRGGMKDRRGEKEDSQRGHE